MLDKLIKNLKNNEIKKHYRNQDVEFMRKKNIRNLLF